PEPRGDTREAIVRIDVATGEQTTLADDVAHDYYHPRISPDGATVAAIRLRRNSATEPPQLHLVLVPADGSGAPVVLAEDWDRWPNDMRWTPDGDALIVVADENGRSPLFRIEVASGSVTRLTADDAAYTDPWVSPDGRHVFALRNGVGMPP